MSGTVIWWSPVPVLFEPLDSPVRTSQKQSASGMKWFERWFNTDYLRLYSGRDEAEAERQVRATLHWWRWAVRRLPSSRPPASPETILDIATGSGRHRGAFSRALPESLVVGIDLSWELLTSAPPAQRVNSIRADMRSLPFAEHSFDLVSSYFTSFGYFDTDDEHAQLLAEWRRVTRPGGLLIIDYLNPIRTLAQLVPETRRELEGSPVTERRTYNTATRRLEKEITIGPPESGRRYLESVRLFGFAEMTALITGSGFEILASVENFELLDPEPGHHWTESGDRMIFLAANPLLPDRRPAGCEQ